MKQLILFGVLANLSIKISAQIPLSIGVTPPNPITSDVIIINCSTIFADGCIRLDSSISVVNDSILITGCYLYNTSSTGITCYDTASFQLSGLNAGSYRIKYVVQALAYPWDTTCTFYDRLDSNSITFTVGPTGIDDPERTNFDIACNVVTNTLQLIHSGKQVNQFFIYSIDGTMTKTFSADKQEIDVSNLSSGMYFLVLENEKQRVVRRFVKE